ncbi:hypothetical protein BHE74_00006584 [Ensete ventricosum]|nr:hypothetical protein BHE74_00006584 [Ensete ventricosum]RZS01025.1 hypothetical protein BHM03_00030817 [Ensete ventricosum]
MKQNLIFLRKLSSALAFVKGNHLETVGSSPCGVAVGAAPSRLPLRSSREWAPPPRGLALAAAGRPFAGGLGHNRLPLAVSQAMVGRPYRGPGRGLPPLQADNMHVAAPPPQAAPTFAANHCNKRV